MSSSGCSSTSENCPPPTPYSLTTYSYDSAVISLPDIHILGLPASLLPPRLAPPRNFHWRGGSFSTPITQGPIICHHQDTGTRTPAS
ncbi:uncharacterized protein SCHCODRAFT_02113965 [Schizophyllum commune H4-8]|uniref:uncharacterized protein n=1 Tax=Schizophyllum commune (strain H4-8 / FGSC 9210) TaxID=578458 RepID=UPI00215F1CBB|nr:uncharacterized protein SCHCODRAFT_02113965 [Schizophyllum commune H4-8]KAI5886146.1 hypothetical protein SCHCODRAFT_02113965 [Schizophyllum commune H4-8]